MVMIHLPLVDSSLSFCILLSTNIMWQLISLKWNIWLWHRPWEAPFGSSVWNCFFVFFSILFSCREAFSSHHGVSPFCPVPFCLLWSSSWLLQAVPASTHLCAHVCPCFWLFAVNNGLHELNKAQGQWRALQSSNRSKTFINAQHKYIVTLSTLSECLLSIWGCWFPHALKISCRFELVSTLNIADCFVLRYWTCTSSVRVNYRAIYHHQYQTFYKKVYR